MENILNTLFLGEAQNIRLGERLYLKEKDTLVFSADRSMGINYKLTI